MGGVGVDHGAHLDGSCDLGISINNITCMSHDYLSVGHELLEVYSRPLD